MRIYFNKQKRCTVAIPDIEDIVEDVLTPAITKLVYRGLVMERALEHVINQFDISDNVKFTAICHPDDEWNEEIGRRIALAHYKEWCLTKRRQLCVAYARRLKFIADQAASMSYGYLKQKNKLRDKLILECVASKKKECADKEPSDAKEPAPEENSSEKTAEKSEAKEDACGNGKCDCKNGKKCDKKTDSDENEPKIYGVIIKVQSESQPIFPPILPPGILSELCG